MQASPQDLTDMFTKVRDSLPMFKKLKKALRPSFHELRAFGMKRYADKGVNVQKLAGHTNQAMTDKYLSGHEIEWTVASTEVIDNDKQAADQK